MSDKREWYIASGEANKYIYLQVYNGKVDGMVNLMIADYSDKASLLVDVDTAKEILECLKAAIERAELEIKTLENKRYNATP